MAEARDDLEVKKLEWRIDLIESRLKEGAVTFGRLRTWAAGAFLGTLASLTSVVWQAAKYPDRAEFTAAQASGESDRESVRREMTQLGEHSATLRVQLESLRDDLRELRDELKALRAIRERTK